MSFDTALLDIICCPVSRQPLQLLPSNKVERANELIEQRKIKNRGGKILDSGVAQWLVTRDGKLAYPIRDGIPVLLEDEGVELSQLAD